MWEEGVQSQEGGECGTLSNHQVRGITFPENKAQEDGVLVGSELWN